MHIANRCAPRKIANGAENLILQSLQLGRYQYFKKLCSIHIQGEEWIELYRQAGNVTVPNSVLLIIKKIYIIGFSSR
jgi:hypothetical protein